MAVTRRHDIGGDRREPEIDPAPLEIAPAAVGAAIIGGVLGGTVIGPLGALVGTVVGGFAGQILNRMTAPHPTNHGAGE